MIDADLKASGSGSTIGLRLVACVAALLAILPAAIALGATAGAPSLVAGAMGTVAAVVAIGKLAAMAWGAGSHLCGGHRASVAAAYAD